MIELATVVVDRKFIEEYPNVRQGPHVLITVTEVRGTMRRDRPLGLPDEPPEPHARSASEKPGVDLGALQELIRDCGGHLWMKIEPRGDMVVKIHLPLRFSDAPIRAPRSFEPGARSADDFITDGSSASPTERFGMSTSSRPSSI